MEYRQLMLAEDGSITEEERDFKRLHQEIIYSGNMAADYAIKMARSLKEMKDKQLYQAAGFEEFEDYTETVGIKARQAYYYISVVENLPEDFLQSYAKLGVSKLSLLASLPAEEREEIVETVDVTNITVNKLKAEIKKRDEEIGQLKLDIDGKEDELNRYCAEDAKYRDAKEAEIKKIQAEEESARKKLAAAELEQTKLKKTIEDLKSVPKIVETVEKPETVAALAAAEQKKEALALEIDTLKKQLTVASDATMLKLKVKFEDLQRIGLEIFALIRTIEPEKATKCREAVKSVISGWNL